MREKRADEDYVLPRPLQVGDNVLIYDIDKAAVVLELPKTGDQVLAGRHHQDARADEEPAAHG